MSPKEVFERLQHQLDRTSRHRGIRLKREEVAVILAWRERSADLFKSQAIGFVHRVTGEGHTTTIETIFQDYMDQLREILDGPGAVR